MATRRKPVMTQDEWDEHVSSRKRPLYSLQRSWSEGQWFNTQSERDGSAWWIDTAHAHACRSQLTYVGPTNLPSTVQVYCARCCSTRYLPTRELRDGAHVCRQCRADPTYKNPRRPVTGKRGHKYKPLPSGEVLTWLAFHIDEITLVPSGKQVVLCHCGSLFLARSNHIHAGRTTSCGCTGRGSRAITPQECAESIYYTLQEMGVTPVTDDPAVWVEQLKEVNA